jgi:hypothetical protein
VSNLSIAVLCDYIILIGALAVAITNIYNFFAKPTSKIKKKKDNDFNCKVELVLDEKLPEKFLEHDLETRDKYLKDRQ